MAHIDSGTTAQGGCPAADTVSVAHNEMLCFIRDKCKVLPFDDIVKICADFYKDEEVLAAKEMIERSMPDRLPKRQGLNKRKTTIEDVVKVCLNPNHVLPTYYAVDMARLPPVSATHCDMSAVLLELQALRSEVREVNGLRNEIACLKQQIETLKGTVEVLRTGQCSSSHAAMNESEFPPLNGACKDDVPCSQTLAAMVESIPKDHPGLKVAARKKKVTPPVIGVSTANTHIKSVETKRNVDVFVSRLHPQTASAELIDCVHAINSDLKIHDVACNRLKSKYESLYSSFHVSITVDSMQLRRAVDVYMSAESWPNGVFVKRFFKRKDGPSN